MNLISVIVTMGIAATLLLFQGEAQIKQAKHLKHMEMKLHEQSIIDWIRKAVNCATITQLNDGVRLESGTAVLTGMHGKMEVKAKVLNGGVELSTRWHQVDPHTGVFNSTVYPALVCQLPSNCSLVRRGNSNNYEYICR